LSCVSDCYLKELEKSFRTASRVVMMSSLVREFLPGEETVLPVIGKAVAYILEVLRLADLIEFMAQWNTTR